MKEHVQAGWNEWRKVSGVMYHKRVSAQMKGKVYKTVVRAAILYRLYIQRRDSQYIDRRMMRLERPGRRSRGRPKRRFMDVVKEDMKLVGVREEDAEDRVRWRQMICCGVPKGKSQKKKKKMIFSILQLQTA